MIPNVVDFVAYERHKDLLRAAERRRLIKALQSQQPDQREKSRLKVSCWIGSQMVNWGLRLQGYRITSPTQIAAASAIDSGRSQN